jgi:leader peptidase (prepilin peptidase) / N-methyltransferase
LHAGPGVDAFADFLSTPAAVGVAAVWGAIWGSFFNVVIARVPAGQSVVRPASRCGACGAAVRAWDNVPILSYFLLRGRCRACGQHFSARYPLVEALTAALSALVFWWFAGSDGGEVVAVRLGRFALYFAFTGTLLVLSFIDFDTKRLPDIITIPGTVVFFLAAFAAHDVPWSERAIGVAAGYLFVRLIADFYYYVLKREGLGLGDGKLLAMVGAVLGWKSLPVVLFAGSVIGVVTSIPLLLLARRRTASEDEAPARGDAPPAPATLRTVQVPFGPFLALGALIYMFAGAHILALVVPGE